MSVTIWTVQIVLGVVFTSAGAFKSFAYRKARTVVPWMPHVSRGTAALVGASELCGGLALLIPGLGLAAFAALGLGTVMLLAAGFHARRGELRALPINLVFLAMAAMVCFARWPGAV